MWEELVGLKSQVLRPNFSASFPCLGEYSLGCLQKCGFFWGGLGGVWESGKQGEEADSSRQRGLNVWTKPNGIFWAKECSGVHWGEPTGPGRTWPLSLFFKIVHLVMLFLLSYGWFDALGLNVFLLSWLCQQLNCFYLKKDGLDDNSCFTGFQ